VSVAAETGTHALPGSIAALEARLRNVENSTQRTAGSVGRADALLVATHIAGIGRLTHTPAGVRWVAL